MKKRRVLLVVFALMIAVGLVLEEHLDILRYARSICLSCMGLE